MGVFADTPADVVCGVEGHEVAGGDEIHLVGHLLPQRHAEPAADHVPQHVVEHHIPVIQQAAAADLLHGHDNAPPGAAGARLRPARLDAADAPAVREGDLPGGAGLELVENGGDAPPHQAPGGVRLGVAAHYRHPFPGLGHGRRQVGHGGGLPDAPFSIDADAFH